MQAAFQPLFVCTGIEFYPFTARELTKRRKMGISQSGEKKGLSLQNMPDAQTEI